MHQLLRPPTKPTQGSSSDESSLVSIMGREVNEDRIQDLEKKIEEGTGDIIQLKRARNSLLNLSTRVPPEILGSIFSWRVRDRRQLGRIREGSYRFLLVCHRWFEVACRTPELWSFWCHTLAHWLQLYRHSGAAAVDLVLNRKPMSGPNVTFDGPLRDALRERSKNNTIRSIKLWNERAPLLADVLAALTPDGDEEVRYSSIESISLRPVDASKFFARCRFPKLSYLCLSMGTQISDWEHVGFHTTALTTLSLTVDPRGMKTVPTTTELLSILTSNPRLQNVTLTNLRALRDDGDRSTVTVPMRNLEKLTIDGDSRSVFQLVQRLDYPQAMDEVSLTIRRCRTEDILGTLGPFARNHIQRDGRGRVRLGIFVKCSTDSVSIQANTIKNTGGQAQRLTFATFTANLRHPVTYYDSIQLCTDFVAHVPVDPVVYFGSDLTMDIVKRIVPTMPNIQEFYLINARLEDGFLLPDPKGSLAHKKLLPSLQRLCLEDVLLDDDSWLPLLPYLAHQTSGGQRISLTISGPREHICKDVEKEMEGFVEELALNVLVDNECPFDHCILSEEEEEDE